MNTQVPPGWIAVISYGGFDSSTPPQSKPLSSLTATVDDYTDCYLTTLNGKLILVQKVAQPEGQTKTVNVTLNGASQDGTPLPPTTLSVDLIGPPPPPQATQIVASVDYAQDPMGLSIGPDPGNATIQII